MHTVKNVSATRIPYGHQTPRSGGFFFIHASFDLWHAFSSSVSLHNCDTRRNSDQLATLIVVVVAISNILNWRCRTYSVLSDPRLFSILFFLSPTSLRSLIMSISCSVFVYYSFELWLGVSNTINLDISLAVIWPYDSVTSLWAT